MKTEFILDPQDGYPIYKAVCHKCGKHENFGVFFCTSCEQLHIICTDCKSVSTPPSYHYVETHSAEKQ